MDTQQAARWLHEQGCTITELGGKPFVIVDAWSDIEDKPQFRHAMETVNPEDPYNWGFSDSFTTCSLCYNAIETQPNSYGWKPDYWIDDGEILCGDCVRSDEEIAEDYIQDRITQASEGKAVGIYIVDPKQYGFRLVARGLEHGLHEGQNEDPRKVIAWANNRGLETVFDVSPGQFTVCFDVYMRPARSKEEQWNEDPYRKLDDKQVNEIREALLARQGKYSDGLRSEFRQWPSPADNTKRALRNLTKPYASIDTDSGEAKEFNTIEEYLAYHRSTNR